MYEKSDVYRAIENILDHAKNGGLDLQKRIELRKRLGQMTYAQLEKELDRLNEE